MARRAAHLGWRIVRPVARPVLWRLRGFFTAPVLGAMQQMRDEQAELMHMVAALAAGARQARGGEPGRLAPAARRNTHGLALRRVHQFHSGAATADAITNAMRLLRDLLRSSGYKSEIFVEQLDPELAGDLLPAEALPSHSDYVLIVRHSIGHRSFDRIASLPAPKLLHYHNITPPELLSGDPGLAAAAAEGRRQLADWRDRVVATTADSAFNAMELRGLGYDVVLECPLLFDVTALRAAAAAAPARPAGTPFTLLFVGRLVDSKGQANLIEAFAEFHGQFGRPSRLVLIGRGSAAAEAALRDKAGRLGIAEDVEIAGVVSDAALHAAYAAADLYVSLSRHEGFGVPLVEAMAHGLPILAWPAGAVPYTLGGAGELLQDRNPQTVARAVLALANDPARCVALAEAGRRRVDAFGLAEAWPVLQSALALAGAAPLPPAGLRSELAANLHVGVAGHFNGSYSLSAVNRTLVRALDAKLPGRVHMQVYEAGKPAAFVPPPGPDGAALAAIAARPTPETGPDVVICQHHPVLRPAHRGDLLLGLQFWEETLASQETVGALSEFRGLLAPARSVAKALIDSGLPIPVRTVGYAPDLRAHAELGAARLSAPPRAPADIIFLHVSSAFPRKGIDVLLAGWSRAFRAGDPVRLVIKAFPNPHNDAAARLAALRQADPGIAPVDLIDHDIDDDAMLDLYRRADAMVLPSRGEGFNMPAAEAIAAGLPVIVTGWGGHMDWLDGESARLLRFTLTRSASHMASPHSQWADPDPEDLAGALRELMAALRDQPTEMAARAAAARQRVLQRLDPGAWAARVCQAALDLMLLPPAPPLRVVWVSTWMQACGIAEHSRLLLDHFVDNPAFAAGGPMVLCDSRPPLLADSAAAALPVRACWQLSGLSGLGRLASSIAAEDPDVVVVQHQTSVLDWSVLAELLRHRVMDGRITLLTLHNTADIDDLAEEQRLEVVEALRRADRLIVHGPADVTRLQAYGLLSRVTLLPAGALQPRAPVPPRVLPDSAAPVLGCFGFFVPGKGIPRLLETVARLRGRWPLLRVRLVNARYPAEASNQEIAACRALAERLGIADAVEWHTDYLPEEQALDLLAGCDLLVLPYKPSRESASGAARVAMASGVPLAVSPVSIFDEMGPAVARISNDDPEEMAAEIAALLSDPPRRARLQADAVAWLSALSWRAMSQRLQGMIQGLAETRRAGG